MENDLPLEPEDSPCQLVCSIDKESNMCFGCGRKPEEIANWPLRTEEDRKRILSELPARMPPLRIKLAERRSRRRVNKRRQRTKSN
ncbi:MAG: DUF1289 domain-containing protein [Robiginitomaculum sp.]